MASNRSHELASLFVAVGVACGSILIAAEPASAASALFRAKRALLIGTGYPFSVGEFPSAMLPPAIAQVDDGKVPSFTAPRSFIKNTTYTYACFGKYCLPGFPQSYNRYSYWNAKGSFGRSNPNASPSTATVRVRTVYDGWPGPAYGPPYAGYTRVTPTEGGCAVNGSTVTHPAQCPGTTRFGGRFAANRAGSIMIWPGSRRFGGTLRFFEGPNAFYSRRVTLSSPFSSTVTSPPIPTSQQLGTGVEIKVGEITLGGGRFRVAQGRMGYQYRLTVPYGTQKLIVGLTPSGGSCTQRPPPYPPNSAGLCAYYRRTAYYLVTRAPYTTGKVRVYHPPSGFFPLTIQTTTGYDNRTAFGLNGVISMVQPRLVQSYIKRPFQPGAPITRGLFPHARIAKIDFHFAPEPAGIASLALGAAALAGLCRIRQRAHRIRS